MGVRQSPEYLVNIFLYGELIEDLPRFNVLLEHVLEIVCDELKDNVLNELVVVRFRVEKVLSPSTSRDFSFFSKKECLRELGRCFRSLLNQRESRIPSKATFPLSRFFLARLFDCLSGQGLQKRSLFFLNRTETQREKTKSTK